MSYELLLAITISMVIIAVLSMGVAVFSHILEKKVEAHWESFCYEDGRKDYWDNITYMQRKQTQKGIDSYGQRIEDNHSKSFTERVTEIEYELIDALMYLEWSKDKYKETENDRKTSG